MKEKISRNKISRHYKSFFGLENMALAENDNLMIDWGESLINELVNQEVEKRIAEMMPRRDELIDEAQKVSKIKLSEREKALIRVTYRVIRSRLSQKTEGGTK